VTGAGGPAGVAVIRAVQRLGRVAVACDIDPLAAGIRLADEGYVVPRYDDPTYVDEVCRLAAKSGARMLVSTIAEEMSTLAAGALQLDDAGVHRWLPAPEAVRRCIDKWRFAELARSSGLSIPRTGLASAAGVPGPWIVKPRFGRGSRDVYAVDEEGDLPWALAQVTDPIVQTRVVGREFTVDALVDRDGTMAGAVPRWRLETKAGISVKGETFVDDTLTNATAALLACVGLEGPANVQGFVDASGTVTFIEVNPRFSGALPLSLAAGADLVGEYLRGIEGLALRPERLAYRPGVRMIRYHEELFEG
jgi:carbamoyl-phosphate synthase large subunit